MITIKTRKSVHSMSITATDSDNHIMKIIIGYNSRDFASTLSNKGLKVKNELFLKAVNQPNNQDCFDALIFSLNKVNSISELY